MDILLTLPRHCAKYVQKHPKEFSQVTAVYPDPEGRKLGSGGATVHALHRHGGEGRRIIVHADGKSRRLPAYAPVGKGFIPFPVFRWGRGQRIDQTLLDVQLPLMKRLLDCAPATIRTLIASGDALVWTDAPEPKIPEADVVVIGAWAPVETMSKHGVFVVRRSDPTQLECMLQKPSADALQRMSDDSMFLLDTGLWLLSDKATDYLFRQCGWDPERREFPGGYPSFYDLYTSMGQVLGHRATGAAELTACVIPLERAEFYHFGSNADLVRSTGALQARVTDQRGIFHKKIKPAPDIFVQNSVTKIKFTEENRSVWIDNSHIAPGWKLHERHLVTGVPGNDWHLELPSGTCLDLVPVGSRGWCIRPYGFRDSFRGAANDPSTSWMERPVAEWFDTRGFRRANWSAFAGADLYECPLFPVMNENNLDQDFIQWLYMVPDGEEPARLQEFRATWLRSRRISCAGIIESANHNRLSAQRQRNLVSALAAMSGNPSSIFYQIDLGHAASVLRAEKVRVPIPPLPGTDSMITVHDLMFRAACDASPKNEREPNYERKAFAMLRDLMLEGIDGRGVNPVLNARHDQVIWARSPVRLDLAGGWTDTPPYCILNGGKVVNLAVELNGQPPIQVFIRPTNSKEVVIRSIDQGEAEVIRTFRDLDATSDLGSPFAIPRAALMLAGFHPRFSSTAHSSLVRQLDAFGGGLDISMMVAVPKGSGLGTSSILAATLLGGLSDLCSLGWDRNELAYRSLLLEQLLTTGGGWQDQYGGLFEGVKLIESDAGMVQSPRVSWAPGYLFTRPASKERMLLYYTGINRVARNILADIVRGMFLNSSSHLAILAEMKDHALATYEAVRRNDATELARVISRSWILNNRLDGGTNPPAVAAIISRFDRFAESYKLLGAGGGGYLLILAKDAGAAVKIRELLEKDPPNRGARFVDWGLSDRGLEVTRS